MANWTAPTIIFKNNTPIKELTSVAQMAKHKVARFRGIEMAGFMIQPRLE